MSERTPVEQEAVDLFLESYFSDHYSPGPIDADERRLIDDIFRTVESQFNPMTYVLGLAIDFAMLAQQISHHDLDAKQFRGSLTEAEMFARYELITKRGKKNVNTLSFRLGKKTRGIRAIEEAVCDLFIKADRTGYPSAYVYNTGMWHHYKDLLIDCFKLSESGRYVLVNRLIDFGFRRFPKNTYFGRETPRVRLFEEIIRHYPRSPRDSTVLH